MEKLIRKTFVGPVLRKDAGDAASKLVFRASDATPDRYGDRVLVAGMNTGEFEANPVLLFGHDHARPVGTAKVWIEGEGEKAALFMSPKFSEATQDARDAKALVEDGVIRAVSVGFQMHEKEPKKNAHGGFDYAKSTLHEISLVSVPANPSAVRIRALDETERAEVDALREAFTALSERVAALEAAAEVPEEALEAVEEVEEEAPKAPAEKSAPLSDVQRAFAAWLAT